MLPLDLTALYGKTVGYIVFLLLGVGFGAALELAGFGDSRRLAAQFYLKDMTVLKTMFTGIVTACLLLFLSSALGFLDFAQIAVNQTYLWPGIVGGLVMGVGFVIGGYCPGTSVVSAASLKLDGIFFFVGTMVGAGFFGETVSKFYDFWNSSFTDRVLVSDWLGWSVGATVFAVTAMALAMFYGAEKCEAAMRGEPFTFAVAQPRRLFFFGALLAVAGSVWAIGQPDAERKWRLMGARYESQLTSRDAFIHPLEYVKTWNDTAIKLVTLDLRSREEFTRFHINGAQNLTPAAAAAPDFAATLAALPTQGVVILIADDEAVAVKTWQALKVQGVNNAYILDQGLRHWHELFDHAAAPGHPLDPSRPSLHVLESHPKDAFQPKIKLKTNKRSGGLCS